MTQTEQWVNQTCERIMALGHVRLYRDLYKDLRERLPCGVACRLISGGLRWTRFVSWPDEVFPSPRARDDRARGIAALNRLERYADVKEWGECCGLYDGRELRARQ